MPRYRTTFSSTVKPETLEYIDSKVDKANGVSRGSVLDMLVDKERAGSDFKSVRGGHFSDFKSLNGGGRA